MEFYFGKIWSTFDSLKLFLIAICIIAISFYKKYKNLPPGPWGLPFVGYLYSIINENVHYKYLDLSRKYGKIFSLKLGQKNLVVIADAKMIKEAFNKEEFSGKPYNEFYKLLGGYGKWNIYLFIYLFLIITTTFYN